MKCTWSEGRQVEDQTQQHQPGVGAGTVVVGPVGLIFHQAGVGTSGREAGTLVGFPVKFIFNQNVEYTFRPCVTKMFTHHRPGDSPAPCCQLGGGLIDRHAGGGDQRRGVLAVTEATCGVQHARLAQPASPTAESRALTSPNTIK